MNTLWIFPDAIASMFYFSSFFVSCSWAKHYFRRSSLTRWCLFSIQIARQIDREMDSAERLADKLGEGIRPFLSHSHSLCYWPSGRLHLRTMRSLMMKMMSWSHWLVAHLALHSLKMNHCCRFALDSCWLNQLSIPSLRFHLAPCTYQSLRAHVSWT